MVRMCAQLFAYDLKVELSCSIFMMTESLWRQKHFMPTTAVRTCVGFAHSLGLLDAWSFCNDRRPPGGAQFSCQTDALWLSSRQSWKRAEHEHSWKNQSTRFQIKHWLLSLRLMTLLLSALFWQLSVFHWGKADGHRTWTPIPVNDELVFFLCVMAKLLSHEELCWILFQCGSYATQNNLTRVKGLQIETVILLHHIQMFASVL